MHDTYLPAAARRSVALRAGGAAAGYLRARIRNSMYRASSLPTRHQLALRAS